MRWFHLSSVALVSFATCGSDCHSPPAEPDAGIDAPAPPDGPPGSKAITITVDGQAPGFVFIQSSPEPTTSFCSASCTTFVAPGAQVTVYGFTPSTFAGWTGACTTTDHACDLGTVTADQAIAVTFNRDEREVATLLPARQVTGLVLTSDGNVAVADSAGVSKLSLTGQVVWATPIAGALDLATDATGDVLGRTASSLFALSAAGAIKWTLAVDTVPVLGLSIESTVAASPDGSVIAVLTSDGALVVDGDGAPRFTVIGQVALGLAVAPDGTVAISTPSTIFIEQNDVLRYNPDGMPLATLGPLPGEQDPSIGYDPAGFVCADTTGHGTATVSRTAPDGATVFATTSRVDAAANLAAGVVADSASNVIAVRAAVDSDVTGLQVDVRSPGGTLTWSHTKPAIEQLFGPLASDGVTPTALAASGKRFAVAGLYNFGTPWIQIYELP